MSRSFRKCSLVWVGMALVIGGSIACGQDGAATIKGDDAHEVFERTRVWNVRLTLTAKEYEAMQSPVRGGFGFGPPAAPAPRTDGREVHRNRFGADQPWANGTIHVGDAPFERVAIRYKGNGTFMDAARTIKKSFKVDLDRLGGKETFHGIKSFNLHCGVTDPSKCREPLSYRLYRAAGVPAPLTTFAEVRLNVAGKFNDELLGVYTLVEDVNKPFLKRTFGNDKGLLLKPEGVRDLEYRGEEWSRYTANFQPKRDATEDEAARVIEFTRLIHQGNDDDFRSKIESFLNVDEYFRFLAVTGMTVSTDSFFALGHNYYMYLHPKTKAFHFIPWDVDRALANFSIFGSADQQMNLSIVHPYPGSHRLTDRLLAIPAMNEKYQAVLRELAEGIFSRQNLTRELALLEEAIRELRDHDGKAAVARKEPADSGFAMLGRPPELNVFIEKRTESIAAQLAGTSKGHIPAPFGMGNFKPGDMLAQPVIDKLDTDKDAKLSRAEWLTATEKLFTDSSKETEGWANEKALATTLNAMFPPPPQGPPGAGGPPGFGGQPQQPNPPRPNAGPPNAGPPNPVPPNAPPAGGNPNAGPRPPGPGGPPRGFNPDMFRPGTMLAGAIFRRADGDKDGKLTKEELMTTAEKLFDAQDSSKSGLLDKPKVAEIFNQLAPPPPGFGPPGGGGPPRGGPGGFGPGGFGPGGGPAGGGQPNPKP